MLIIIARMSYARENRSTRATIDRDHIFASGSNMNVYAGEYTEGDRAGEPCVGKVFKTGSVFENSYFAVELKVVDETLAIVNKFNDDGPIDTKIVVNIPEIWERACNGELSLVEPMIDNFEKFNSNTGWVPARTNPWLEVMQALSHYSYHTTNGRLLLCDLQGGVYKDGFIITDPVIMSENREYGPTDLGLEGIHTFFARHKCNQYCSRRGWMRPQGVRAHFPAQHSTSMMLVPTRHSRAHLTYAPQRQQPRYNPIQEDYY